MSEPSIDIRPANIQDIDLILDFIAQKAEFDGCSHLVKANSEKLRQTLFTSYPLAQVIFAEVEGIAVGFALFFDTYSSFLAQPNIWLDDLFVQPQMRGKGIGKSLLIYLAELAQTKNCGRIEWTVDRNNIDGVLFYEKIGARIVDKVKLCRLDAQGMINLSDRSDIVVAQNY